jgi:CHAD domain-containing protein
MLVAELIPGRSSCRYSRAAQLAEGFEFLSEFATKIQSVDREPAASSGRWVEGLSVDMSLPEGLEIVFRQRFSSVLRFLPLVVRNVDTDITYVHKLRVACRRLAAVCDVLAEGFPEAPRKNLVRIVRSIRKCCGKARDLDVRKSHLESLLKMSSVEDSVVLELLCQSMVRTRRKVQTKLIGKLRKLQPALCAAGEEILASLRSGQRSAAGGDASFRKTGYRIVTEESIALWDKGEADLKTADALHQLRIACKRLRYAVEIFMPVLPRAFLEDFYPQLENIQELLGEFHDAAVATAAFHRLKKKWKACRGTRKWEQKGLADYRWRELRSGLDSILLAYAQQADQARTEFFDLWPGFSGASFRQPVAELLAARCEPPAPQEMV